MTPLRVDEFHAAHKDKRVATDARVSWRLLDLSSDVIRWWSTSSLSKDHSVPYTQKQQFADYDMTFADCDMADLGHNDGLMNFDSPVTEKDRTCDLPRCPGVKSGTANSAHRPRGSAALSIQLYSSVLQTQVRNNDGPQTISFQTHPLVCNLKINI